MNRPFPAYKGDAPYLFVCYSHADAHIVYPELVWLRNQGFNVWYDEGISAGADWRDEIAHFIDGAAVFVYFLSPASAQSPDCQRELSYAVDENKPMLVVEFEPTELRGGLRLAIAPLQIIRSYEVGAEPSRNRMLEALRQHLRHSIRLLTEQTIVVSDLRRFGVFSRTAPAEAVEDLLVRYENMAVDIAEQFEGVVRSIDGDSCLLSFVDANQGVRSVLAFAKQWQAFVAERAYAVELAMGASFGDFRLFRSFSYGGVLSVAFGLCTLAKSLPSPGTTAVLGDRLVARLEDRSACRAVDPSEYFGSDDAESRANRLLYAQLLQPQRTFELKLDR